MKKLPYHLQILNKFIFEKPAVVVRILKENGIKVSNRPILPEIIDLSVQAIADKNEGFIKDVYNTIENEDESNFATIAISAALSIGSAIASSKQAKKQREAMYNATLMKLQAEQRLSDKELQVEKELGTLKILTDSLNYYADSLQDNATIRQRDTALFIGIMGVGLAVMYATIQLFKIETNG